MDGRGSRQGEVIVGVRGGDRERAKTWAALWERGIRGAGCPWSFP